LEKQVLSARGVQAGRKALRIRHMNGMEVRKKRPRGFKKEAQGVQVSPLNPLSVAPCCELVEEVVDDVGGEDLDALPVGELARQRVDLRGRICMKFYATLFKIKGIHSKVGLIVL
jgi:hypothetical protein